MPAPLLGGDTRRYSATMPNKPKTKAKPIRIPLGLWNAAGDAAAEQETDRSALIRDFFNWYTRRPGAKPLKRPDAGEWSIPKPGEDDPAPVGEESADA